jgi:hypothetical protein
MPLLALYNRVDASGGQDRCQMSLAGYCPF